MVDGTSERRVRRPSLRAGLMQMDPDPTEIQGSADEIARSKVVQAWEEIRERVATPFGSEDRADAERPRRRAREAPRAVRFRRDGRRRLGMRCLPGPYCKPCSRRSARRGCGNWPADMTTHRSRVPPRLLRARRTETRDSTNAPIDSNDTDDWFRTPRFSSEPWTARSSVPPLPRPSTKGELEFVFTPQGRTRRSRAPVRRAGGLSHCKKALDAFPTPP